jgi:hypothetical protein
MGKGVLQQYWHKLVRLLTDDCTFFTLLLAAGCAWVLKEPLTPLVFNLQTDTPVNLFPKLAVFLLTFMACALVIAALKWSNNKLSALLPHSKPLNTTIDISSDRRLSVFLIILGAGLAVILLVNQVLPHIDTVNWTYVNPKIIPTMDPVGNDFRTGLYRPPHLLLQGEQIYYLNEDGSNLTQYPPLLNLLFMLYQLFTEDTACLIHMIVLFIANLACLALAARWAKDFILPHTDFEPQTRMLIAWLIFIFMTVYTFTGYPFLFSIERGNYDILALLFAMLAINSLLYKPNRIWLQVILLSIAVHLKIYPIALFVPFLFKYGKKLILPALAVNVAFLLALGPANALTFLQIIRQNVATGFTWVGNHSGFSFATYVSWGYQSASENVDWLRTFFTVLPAVMWAAAAFWAFKKLPSEPANTLFLFMATAPLMDVIPPISHDYKSVLLGPAVILLLCFLAVKILWESNFWDYFLLLLVTFFLLVLGRSFALNADQALLLNHKYPVIMLLFAIILIVNKNFVEKSRKMVNTD